MSKSFSRLQGRSYRSKLQGQRRADGAGGSTCTRRNYELKQMPGPGSLRPVVNCSAQSLQL